MTMIFVKKKRAARETHNQDKITLRIENVYTELYDSDQSTCPIIHTDRKEVAEITPRKVAVALRDIREGARKQHHKLRDIKSRRRYHLKDTCYAVL